MFMNHINAENRYRVATRLNPIDHCAFCTQPSVPFVVAIRDNSVEGKWKLSRTEKALRIYLSQVSLKPRS